MNLSKLKVNTNQLEFCQEFILILNVSGNRISELDCFLLQDFKKGVSIDADIIKNRFNKALTEIIFLCHSLINSPILISVTFSSVRTRTAWSKSSKLKMSTAWFRLLSVSPYTYSIFKLFFSIV